MGRHLIQLVTDFDHHGYFAHAFSQVCVDDHTDRPAPDPAGGLADQLGYLWNGPWRVTLTAGQSNGR